MQTNKPFVEKLLARKRIPPRALRSDTPGGTVWVPRWKWAGRLFGREVQLPPTLGTSHLSEPTTKAAAPEPSTAAAEQGVEPTTSKASKNPENAATPQESWGAWAYPLLVILAVLVVAYALGATFGYALAVGHLPLWMSVGPVGAFLQVPSGALLLLLAALACFVQARDERGTRRIWQVSGGMLLVFSLLATFGGIL